MNYQTLHSIAKEYGVKLHLNPQGYEALYYGDKIEIGIQDSTEEIIRAFLHELGHFVSYKAKKYKYYHDPIYFNQSHRYFKSYKDLIKYSLKSEIFADKMAKQLAKKHFPEFKYKAYYKNNKDCYNFLEKRFKGLLPKFKNSI